MERIGMVHLETQKFMYLQGDKFELDKLLQQVLFFSWCWLKEGSQDFDHEYQGLFGMMVMLV